MYPKCFRLFSFSFYSIYFSKMKSWTQLKVIYIIVICIKVFGK